MNATDTTATQGENEMGMVKVDGYFEKLDGATLTLFCQETLCAIGTVRTEGIWVSVKWEIPANVPAERFAAVTDTFAAIREQLILDAIAEDGDEYGEYDGVSWVVIFDGE